MQNREGGEEEKREDNGNKVVGSGEAEEYDGDGVGVEVEDEAVDDTGDDIGFTVDVRRTIDGVGRYVGP